MLEEEEDICTVSELLTPYKILITKENKLYSGKSGRHHLIWVTDVNITNMGQIKLCFTR